MPRIVQSGRPRIVPTYEEPGSDPSKTPWPPSFVTIHEATEYLRYFIVTQGVNSASIRSMLPPQSKPSDSLRVVTSTVFFEHVELYLFKNGQSYGKARIKALGVSNFALRFNHDHYTLNHYDIQTFEGHKVQQDLRLATIVPGLVGECLSAATELRAKAVENRGWNWSDWDCANIVEYVDRNLSPRLPAQFHRAVCDDPRVVIRTIENLYHGAGAPEVCPDLNYAKYITALGQCTEAQLRELWYQAVETPNRAVPQRAKILRLLFEEARLALEAYGSKAYKAMNDVTKI